MTPPTPAAKLLIRNALLLTMEPGAAPFVGHLLVGPDGRITAVGPGDPPAGAAAGAELDAAGRIVAPGFISAHSHLFQSPLRGLGTDQTLYGWLGAIKLLSAHASPEDIYWFCLHGSVDFLRNGITTGYDFTYTGDLGGGQHSIGIGEEPGPIRVNQEPYEEAQIRAKLDSGLRFINSFSIVPEGTEAEIDARVARIVAYARAFAGEPRFLKMAISGWVQRAPDIAAAHREVRFMREFGLMNQAHFLESPERVPEQQAKFAWYRDAGALGPNFIFGHFIHTTPEIIAETARSGACMCWQPAANGRLGSGTADIPALRKAGIKVGIGARFVSANADQVFRARVDRHQPPQQRGLLTMRSLGHRRHKPADGVEHFDRRVPALGRQGAGEHNVAVKQRTDGVHQRVLLVVALH